MDKRLYLGLAAAGLIIPYSQFIPFLLENGVNIGLIFHEITAYRISAFAWLDVVVTAIVVIAAVLDEREGIPRWWAAVVATLLVGPSCGLPLYMYLRG